MGSESAASLFNSPHFVLKAIIFNTILEESVHHSSPVHFKVNILKLFRFLQPWVFAIVQAKGEFARV